MSQAPLPPAYSMPTDNGYNILARWLAAAYEQSRHGKGVQRHGNGKPFTEQQIIRNSRDTGGIGALTQAHKKIEEALGMMARGEHDKALHELKGAMVYVAAGCDGIECGRRWIAASSPDEPAVYHGPFPPPEQVPTQHMVENALQAGRARSFAAVDID